MATDYENLPIRLRATLEAFREDPDSFGRSDMDEIAMLTAACEKDLPARLVNLIKSTDKDFPVGIAKRIDFLARALRIIEVQETLPDSQTYSDSTELLPTFSLAKKDKERVLKLCGDMRKIVFSSVDFDEPHKKRLLNRIAAIETQVYSQKGLFDVILGGVSDVGDITGEIRPRC